MKQIASMMCIAGFLLICQIEFDLFFLVNLEVLYEHIMWSCSVHRLLANSLL